MKFENKNLTALRDLLNEDKQTVFSEGPAPLTNEQKRQFAEAVKTYQARIKVAGELPENFEAQLKNYMTKYETIEFKKIASTPVQEHPHEFTRLKNVEVSIFDVETGYPIGYQQLESVLKDEFGIAGDHIRVKDPTDPTDPTAPTDPPDPTHPGARGGAGGKNPGRTTDPKQNSNELSVTIYFDTNISKDEAVTQTSLLLGDIGAE